MCVPYAWLSFPFLSDYMKFHYVINCDFFKIWLIWLIDRHLGTLQFLKNILKETGLTQKDSPAPKRQLVLYGNKWLSSHTMGRCVMRECSLLFSPQPGENQNSRISTCSTVHAGLPVSQENLLTGLTVQANVSGWRWGTWAPATKGQLKSVCWESLNWMLVLPYSRTHCLLQTRKNTMPWFPYIHIQSHTHASNIVLDAITHNRVHAQAQTPTQNHFVNKD